MMMVTGLLAALSLLLAGDPVRLSGGPLAVPPVAAPADPPAETRDLPEGALLLISGTAEAAHFSVLDGQTRRGDIIDAWRYTAMVPPAALRGGTTVFHIIEHELIDCRGRTVESLVTLGYSDTGRIVIWLPPKPPVPIKARSTHDRFAQVLCDNYAIPPTNRFTGYRDAYAATKVMLTRR